MSQKILVKFLSGQTNASSKRLLEKLQKLQRAGCFSLEEKRFGGKMEGWNTTRGRYPYSPRGPSETTGSSSPSIQASTWPVPRAEPARHALWPRHCCWSQGRTRRRRRPSWSVSRTAGSALRAHNKRGCSDGLTSVLAGLRIRIRIGSVFNRFSGSGSRRAKMTHKSS